MRLKRWRAIPSKKCAKMGVEVSQHDHMIFLATPQEQSNWSYEDMDCHIRHIEIFSNWFREQECHQTNFRKSSGLDINTLFLRLTAKKSGILQFQHHIEMDY